mmetsp:Transcript_35674/g.113374  ORF Transcript_35674/g.113374 Transcript_35674/m.113374 type:complete len:407 (+) Transcript_35674:193-1413(+)
MAGPAGAQIHRAASRPLEAVGLLHAHRGPDLHPLCPEAEGATQADDLPAVGRSKQQHDGLCALPRQHWHDHPLHRLLHARDNAGGLPQRLPEARAPGAGGPVHAALHGGVLLPPRRLHQRRHLALPLRDFAHERRGPRGADAILLGGADEVRGLRRHAGPAAGAPRAARAPRAHPEAEPLRLRHAPRGRGAEALDAGRLGAGLPPQHGRGALLQRPLPPGEAELPAVGGPRRPGAGGVLGRVRRRLQPWRLADVRPVLHRGLGAQRLPQHHRGLLVVHDHHDLRGLRRSLPADHPGQVRGLRGHAGGHGAHRAACGHSGPEVPGRLRVARPRRGQVPRRRAHALRRQGLGRGPLDGRAAEAAAAEAAGPRGRGLRGQPGRGPGEHLGAARAPRQGAEVPAGEASGA